MLLAVRLNSRLCFKLSVVVGLEIRGQVRQRHLLGVVEFVVLLRIHTGRPMEVSRDAAGFGVLCLEGKSKYDEDFRTLLQDYGDDLRLIGAGSSDGSKHNLRSTARRSPNVLEDPALSSILVEFSEHAIKLVLRFYVESGHGTKTKDEVQRAIAGAFNKHGIRFAQPRLSISFPENPQSTPGASDAGMQAG